MLLKEIQRRNGILIKMSFMATNITNLLNNIISQTDTNEKTIQKLFEFATNNTIENCKKDFHQAHCYVTPIPKAYWGYDDFRTEQDKYIEKICNAAIVLAHSLSVPLKRDLDFYDLICCALPYTSDLREQKARYSEIIRYTQSERIRDFYAEQLTSVNKKLQAINCVEIATSLYPKITNLPKTLEAWDILWHQCDAPYNPVRVSNIGMQDNNLVISITGFVSAEKLTCKRIRFKFYDVKSFSYDVKATTSFPKMYLSDFEEKCVLHKDCFTFQCGDALSVRAKKLETLDIFISEEPLYDENE